MPLSIEHEAPLELCSRHPELVPELLRRLCGQEVPTFSSVKLAPASFNQTVAQEFRADRALICENEGKPVLAVVLEVQRQADERKHRAWPLYTSALFAEHGCMTYLLVLATSAATAKWARQPIPRFHPTSPWSPLVLGPDEIPRIESVLEAEANVPMSLLSALVHADEDGGERVAYSALRALHHAAPSPTEAIDRLWWMLGLLGGIVSKERFTNIQRLIMLDPSTRFVPRTEFDSPPYFRGIAEGQVKGEAEALLTVLSARGLEPDEARQQRIKACQDLAQLKQWLRRAVTASSLDDVFA